MTAGAEQDKRQDWTFQGFAPEFDAHVREQLPWYGMATESVALIARHYIPRRGLVYDLGASTGNVGRALSSTLTEPDTPISRLMSWFASSSSCFCLSRNDGGCL